MKRYLIFGASGFIGRRLLSAVEGDGSLILGTGCRNVPIRNGFRFDFRKDSFGDFPGQFTCRAEGKDSFAVICSAVSRIDLCRTDPESYDINVTKTVALACRLADAGYKVCFISTDHVFNGIRGGYSEDEPVNPINEYGRQKSIAEQQLLEKIPGVLIARLSKQLCVEADPTNIFTQWHDSVRRGIVIRNVRGMEISPTDVEDTVRGILILMHSDCSGIYHVCNSEHFFRHVLCSMFLQIYSERFGGIYECREEPVESFRFSDARPLKTWLANGKFIQKTGMEFMSMRRLAADYLEHSC